MGRAEEGHVIARGSCIKLNVSVPLDYPRIMVGLSSQ